MSIIESIKETVGVESDNQTLECAECGHNFQKEGDPDSYWLRCPSCDAGAVEVVEG